MKTRFNSSLQGALVLLVLIAGAIGYFYFIPSGAPAHEQPLPQVTVKTLSSTQATVWSEFSGRLNAVDYAEIRPEVTGRITEVRFKDGQTVKKGDILFVIDPRPFQDTVDRDLATVTSTKAKMELARVELQRNTTLADSQAVSKQELDIAVCNTHVAEADFQDAEANLKQAQIDLEHAYVAAPISGRTSRAEITVGNVVQSGQTAPRLTSIVSQDGIYADFEVDESTYLQTIRRNARNEQAEEKIPVQLLIPDDVGHVYRGFIESFDNKIDNASGTIRARAKFANEDGALTPGMFASIRLASTSMEPVLLVPDKAIGFDQSKKYVYVVDSSSRVSYREVVLGHQVGDSRIALSGLKPGERVIVDDLQTIRPNSTVEVKEMKDDDNVAATQNQAAPSN